jgi:hypothetical protein
MWQILVSDLYEACEISAFLRPVTPSSFIVVDRILRASLAGILLTYVNLWTVKMSFLAFFFRLGENVRGYKRAWWAVLVFTIAAGIACLGSIPYPCMASTAARTMVQCAESRSINTLKVNCALDVFTDALSKFSLFGDTVIIGN